MQNCTILLDEKKPNLKLGFTIKPMGICAILFAKGTRNQYNTK